MPPKKKITQITQAHFTMKIPVRGGGGLGLIFAEYVPLASQSPYPISLSIDLSTLSIL